ncbi:MAG TPA: methylenetetrahydrofolate reductase [Acidimicrobiales bacterium]|nr:methylenetetrahydrofolate reductase [Acidimicrobiales bacterium]
MARIDELLADGRTYSFEFFPPKTPAARTTLAHTLQELQPLEPSFVSVTYGAGGSTREWTHELVAGMLHTTTLNPMAHLTCVSHTRLELAEILVRYRRAGVENVLCLGGDPPRDRSDLAPGELAHASELVHLARAIGGFSIGVAAHPLTHPSSPDRASDRRWLAAKLEEADFAITQFFFRLDEYERLRDELDALGCRKPVVPGIMPITNMSSVARMGELVGYPVPREVVARFDGLEDDPDAVRREGVAVATELCVGLLATGAPGLHFITLNQSRATREIYAELGLPPAASR